MSELRAALEAALGPIYRIEREVRPVGNCRLFVAGGTPAAPELLVKGLPAELSLAVDARAFAREVGLLADRLGPAAMGGPEGAGRRVRGGRAAARNADRRASGGGGGGTGRGAAPATLARRVGTPLPRGGARRALARRRRGTGGCDSVGRGGRRGGRGVTRTPVLCYHRIGGPLELGVTRVARGVFERQMAALARAGWRTQTLDQFASAVRRTAAPAGNEFLLTFDDGYASLAAHAYPVLARQGFTATTFLVTDHVGATNTWDVRYTWRRLPHLDWRTVEEWRARGFDFASHTASHARLTWLGDARAAQELGRSRDALVRRLGAAAGRAIAYPFGAADERIERLARAAGYELGFGGVHANGSGLRVPRVPVYWWDAWSVPFGLRSDALGTLGRSVAHAANRCAVGTSWMLALRRGPAATSA